MNEIINKLAEQCYITGPLTRDGWPEYTKFDEQKFAKLLIQECTNIAYEYDEPKMSGPGMIIAVRIEQHFGVEE